MKNYLYLIIDLACISIPFIASFYPKHAFYKQWKAFFFSCFIVAVPFLVWDEIFTVNEIWGFNPEYLTGIYLGSLPLEEILFFICIPYACTFTYFAMQYLLNQDPLAKYQLLLKYIFLGISVLFVILGYNQWYTLITGIFTSLLMIYMIWGKVDFRYGFLSYFLILPFFFASNGVLTGSFLPSPIVWYNDAENFGIRMFTIPIEDSIYGFLMIASNFILFDYFSKSKQSSIQR